MVSVGRRRGKKQPYDTSLPKVSGCSVPAAAIYSVERKESTGHLARGRFARNGGFDSSNHIWWSSSLSTLEWRRYHRVNVAGMQDANSQVGRQNKHHDYDDSVLDRPVCCLCRRWRYGSQAHRSREYLISQEEERVTAGKDRLVVHKKRANPCSAPATSHQLQRKPRFWGARHNLPPCEPLKATCCNLQDQFPFFLFSSFLSSSLLANKKRDLQSRYDGIIRSCLPFCQLSMCV